MTAPSVDGLDIHGSFQPVSDWSAIPQFPVMSVKGTEGATATQVNGRAYFLKFRERGFHYRGVYHWLRPDSPVKDQFDNVKRWWDSVGGMQQGEFIQNDWERTLDKNGAALPMPTLAQVVEFNDRVQQQWPGRLVVYVSDWVDNFHQWLATNPVEPIWYANYNTDPNNKGGGWQECAKYHATLWQFTSQFMSPGITKRTDANHIFDYAALDIAAGYAAGSAPPPPVDLPPVARPTPTSTQEDEMIFRCNGEIRKVDGQDYQPGIVWYEIMSGGGMRHVTTYEEVQAQFGVNFDPAPYMRPNAVLDQIPAYTPPAGGASSPCPPCPPCPPAPTAFDITASVTAK